MSGCVRTLQAYSCKILCVGPGRALTDCVWPHLTDTIRHLREPTQQMVGASTQVLLAVAQGSHFACQKVIGRVVPLLLEQFHSSQQVRRTLYCQQHGYTYLCDFSDVKDMDCKFAFMITPNLYLIHLYLKYKIKIAPGKFYIRCLFMFLLRQYRVCYPLS